MASYIRCFLKQYICLVTYLLSGHFIIYDVQTAYIVHITCESERARKASTPGVERARAFKYFNNLMREMRTFSTTFRFIKKRKKRRKKRIESEERFILGSSKTLASRTLNFPMPHLLTQQRQFMEMQVEVQGVKNYCRLIFR